MLLVSAGIGITPGMSALEHLAETSPDRVVTLVHADRAGRTHALRQRLPELARRLPSLRIDLWYEHRSLNDAIPRVETTTNTGLVDPSLIPVPPDAHVHLCGPLPFMAHVRNGLLRRGVPTERIAYEVFGPEMLHGVCQR